MFLELMEYCLIMNLHLRGETFVTRKISKAVGRIAAGIQVQINLR
jgi:GDP-D-mannose dehydratase